MRDPGSADPIVGRKIRFTWTDGPTQGETHEHVFNADGSVDYHKVTNAPAKSRPTHENQYGAVKVADDVYIVSYLGSSGFTLTVALNFRDKSIAGFASNDKQWFPVKGTLEAG